jgi:hypothetical protein
MSGALNRGRAQGETRRPTADSYLTIRMSYSEPDALQQMKKVGRGEEPLPEVCPVIVRPK